MPSRLQEKRENKYVEGNCCRGWSSRPLLPSWMVFQTFAAVLDCLPDLCCRLGLSSRPLLPSWMVFKTFAAVSGSPSAEKSCTGIYAYRGPSQFHCSQGRRCPWMDIFVVRFCCMHGVVLRCIAFVCLPQWIGFVNHSVFCIHGLKSLFAATKCIQVVLSLLWPYSQLSRLYSLIIIDLNLPVIVPLI